MVFLITITKGAKKILKSNFKPMDNENFHSKLYSTSEIAEELDLSRANIIALSQKGAFKYLVEDDLIKITESELNKLKTSMTFVNHLVKVLNDEEKTITLKSQKGN